MKLRAADIRERIVDIEFIMLSTLYEATVFSLHVSVNLVVCYSLEG
jgi:hypothetical protein